MPVKTSVASKCKTVESSFAKLSPYTRQIVQEVILQLKRFARSLKTPKLGKVFKKMPSEILSYTAMLLLFNNAAVIVT